ncbi:MAG: cysteine--tRNA ligase [Candidatus Aminicenantes bacterium]|nr:cysteine--tRNA ligase [Candidatus Aminicenantes bacterium]
MIRFFNTLSGRLEVFEPLRPGEVRLYTCGPTVYDYAHIGNFRAYIFEDLLKRFLLYSGYRVFHVMNITDVDDKTIRNSQAQGLTLAEYTQKYINAFFEDIKVLNILPADVYPRATEHIPEMVNLIKILLAKGFAYEKDGSIYYSIARFPSYGQLAKIKPEELKPGARLEADEYEKERAHDFVLWKKRKEGEPFWETELGPGRPGWHIECSAMSMKYLGETFDLHCGGVDNIFPHHENEIAQSEAATGKPFVRYWLHCHHLIVEGEKMSKSKGNFYTLRDLLNRGVDPLALRFLLLSTHYRKTLNFTFEALEQATASLQRLRDFQIEIETRTFPEGYNEEVNQIISLARKEFKEGLSDDLNISLALSAVFSLIRKVNLLLQQGQIKNNDILALKEWLKEIDQVLGVLPPPPKALPEEIMAKIRLRERARQEKNYALADRLRQELLEQGILLEDTREGTRWKIISPKKTFPQ